jgi:hypothetical protein
MLPIERRYLLRCFEKVWFCCEFVPRSESLSFVSAVRLRRKERKTISKSTKMWKRARIELRSVAVRTSRIILHTIDGTGLMGHTSDVCALTECASRLESHLISIVTDGSKAADLCSPRGGDCNICLSMELMSEFVFRVKGVEVSNKISEAREVH